MPSKRPKFGQTNGNNYLAKSISVYQTELAEIAAINQMKRKTAAAGGNTFFVISATFWLGRSQRDRQRIPLLGERLISGFFFQATGQNFRQGPCLASKSQRR